VVAVVEEILFVDHQVLEEQVVLVVVELVVEALEVHVEQQEQPILVVAVEVLNLADLLMQVDQE
tara:strand:+ start:672 stop:863 length:192 start_codon:yes stop_codon:yes gene_type:complete